MKRIGDLEFEFAYGACNTFEWFGILLCFPQGSQKTDTAKRCSAFQISEDNTILITEEASSNYSHQWVSLGSYRGLPFVTGSGRYRGADHSKTEILYKKTNKWESKTDFPFFKR